MLSTRVIYVYIHLLCSHFLYIYVFIHRKINESNGITDKKENDVFVSNNFRNLT